MKEHLLLIALNRFREDQGFLDPAVLAGFLVPGNGSTDRAYHAGLRSQQGKAEVDVVEHHQGLFFEASVFYFVLQGKASGSQLGLDRSREDQVFSHCIGFPHPSFHSQPVLISVPLLIDRYVLRGCVGNPAVQSERFALIHAGSAGVGYSAGGEQSGVEAAQPG